MSSINLHSSSSSKSRPKRSLPPFSSPSSSTSFRSFLASPVTSFLLPLVVFPLLLYLYILVRWDRQAFPLIHPKLTASENVLWVIAHPDDESLFFAPSITNLILPPHTLDNQETTGSIPRRRGHLLSLSTGNESGLGNIRKRELRASCLTLGIAIPNCVSLDHTELPDDPKIWWEARTIEELVRIYIEKWEIDTVITFDDYGVSGHANHRAISVAIAGAVFSSSEPAFPQTFILKSSSLLPKYTSLFSLPYLLFSPSHYRQTALPSFLSHNFVNYTLPPSLLSPPSNLNSESKDSPTPPAPQFHAPPSNYPPSLIISSPAQYLQARLSFKQHKSQSRWFRSLFMLFSRYLWVTELEDLSGLLLGGGAAEDVVGEV